MNEVVNNQTKENSKFSSFLTKILIQKDGSMKPMFFVIVFAGPLLDSIKSLYSISKGLIPLEGYRAQLGFVGSSLMLSLFFFSLLFTFLFERAKKRKSSIILPMDKVYWLYCSILLFILSVAISIYAFTTAYTPGEFSFKILVLLGCLVSSLSVAMLVGYVLIGSVEAKLAKALAVKKPE